MSAIVKFIYDIILFDIGFLLTYHQIHHCLYYPPGGPPLLHPSLVCRRLQQQLQHPGVPPRPQTLSSSASLARLRRILTRSSAVSSDRLHRSLVTVLPPAEKNLSDVAELQECPLYSSQQWQVERSFPIDSSTPQVGHNFWPHVEMPR